MISGTKVAFHTAKSLSSPVVPTRRIGIKRFLRVRPMQTRAIFARCGRRKFFKIRKQKGTFHFLTSLGLSENAFSYMSVLLASQDNYGMAHANLFPLVGLLLSVVVFESFLSGVKVRE